MIEEHLDHLSEFCRNFVPGRFAVGACHVPSNVVFFAGYLAAVGLGAAFGFRWAGPAGVFESPTLGDTFAGRDAIGV